MLTGDLRNQIDRLWDSFWSGGISNPLEVIEQITYLLFLRRLDELQQLEENKANRLGGTAFRLWAMKVATPTSPTGRSEFDEHLPASRKSLESVFSAVKQPE